jgi:hypothetical protein
VTWPACRGCRHRLGACHAERFRRQGRKHHTMLNPVRHADRQRGLEGRARRPSASPDTDGVAIPPTVECRPIRTADVARNLSGAVRTTRTPPPPRSPSPDHRGLDPRCPVRVPTRLDRGAVELRRGGRTRIAVSPHLTSEKGHRSHTVLGSEATTQPRDRPGMEAHSGEPDEPLVNLVRARFTTVKVFINKDFRRRGEPCEPLRGSAVFSAISWAAEPREKVRRRLRFIMSTSATQV